MSQVLFSVLQSWFQTRGRDLPWRGIDDPYAIWVSEIMLQQTQVERVKEFYQKFLERFPTVESLAQASWEEVLERFRGLGYYRRARLLWQGARVVVEQYGGVFPRSFVGLRALPGIGDYTAAAIASFAFGERVPALDTNLQRVLGRYLGDEWDLMKPKERFEFAQNLIPTIPGVQTGAIFNQALMDIGSSHCTAKKINCADCPLREVCVLGKMRALEPDTFAGLAAVQERGKSTRLRRERSTSSTKNLPKTLRIKVAVGVLIHEGKIVITKRKDSDSFGGFWEFPGGKVESGEDERMCLKRELAEELGVEVAVRPPFYRTEYESDGRILILSFHRCSLLLGDPKPLEAQELRWVKPQELYDYQFPPANTPVFDLLVQKKAMFYS